MKQVRMRKFQSSCPLGPKGGAPNHHFINVRMEQGLNECLPQSRTPKPKCANSALACGCGTFYLKLFCPRVL